MRIQEGAKRVTIAQGSVRSRMAFFEGRRVRARARVVGMPRAWRAIQGSRGLVSRVEGGRRVE